jgi:hypothetical protein
VNALAAHLAHDAFGVPRCYPALSHPSRGAGPRLLDRVGGRPAFGRAFDVRTWEQALDRGEAQFVKCKLPPGAGKRIRPTSLPDEIVALMYSRGANVEIISVDHVLRPGDDVFLVSLLDEEGTCAVLESLEERSGTYPAVETTKGKAG